MGAAWRIGLGASWLALALLANLTTVPLANGWESPRWQLVLVSVWLIIGTWLVLPRRLFLVVSFPVLFAGIAIVVADRLRGANLLELLAIRYTFRAGEVTEALHPFTAAFVLTGLALAGLAAAQWAPASRPRPPAVLLALALAGVVMALVLPARSWRDAWPVALVAAWAEGHMGDAGIALPLLANVRTSPRDRFETWGARRGEPASGDETYVLVIGESVRADRLPGCGGRPEVTAAPPDALLYCDVLSGSSGTHTSIPLLISRDQPGLRERVPRDASVLKAFEAVGFETYWLGVQERSIAWPDAMNQVFDPTPGLDRDALLPLLDAALARPAPRKVIVLHAYNAHAPYAERYRPGHAPFPPGDGTGWNDYDNAIDETMQFLGMVVNRLRARPGAAFLVFTPDHGENMRDDPRQLIHHALKVPTLWDTRVPAVIWANAAWRGSHAGRWDMLGRNRQAALMHMDVVPTLLGAAGIRYQDRRTLPVDLGARLAPRRTRFTHRRPGEIMTEETLVEQTRNGRPDVQR